MVIPGTGAILKTAMDQKDEITAEQIAEASDPALICMISRELHGLLYVKTKGKARAHVEHLDVHRGLECFRQIKSNLFRMDPKRLKLEYDQLTSLEPSPEQKRYEGRWDTHVNMAR